MADSGDLIDAIQRDHREIEKMLEKVSSTSGDARRSAFAELTRKLKAHETAEQEVVHPLTADGVDPEEAATLQSEESAASKALKDLQDLDVDSSEFDNGFARLKADVLAHAQEEERDEHPLLERDLSASELERSRQEFEDRERDAANG